MQFDANRIGSWCIVAGVSGMLAACQSPPQINAPDGASEAAQAKPTEPVEVILYGTDAEEMINSLYLEPFNKKYPNIRLKYLRGTAADGTSLPQLIAAGTKFDVYYGTSGSFENTLNAYGLGYDLTDMLGKHGYDISHLEPSAIETLKRNTGGKLYGLPSNMLSYLLYYNKAVFDQFGVSYPKDGMTWDEVFHLAQKMTRADGSKSYYGLSHASPINMINLNPFGLPLADGQTNKPLIQTEERWKTLIQALFLNAPVTQAYREMGKLPDWKSFSKDQNLAMITYSNTVPTALKADIAPLNWDMVSIPVFSQLPRAGTQATPVYFGVASVSEHKEEATRVVEYFSSIEFSVKNSKAGVLMASTAPEVVKVLGSETDFPDKNWGAIRYHPFAPLAPKSIYFTEVLNVYNKNLTPVLAGQVDLNTALRTMEEQAQKEIDAKLKQ